MPQRALDSGWAPSLTMPVVGGGVRVFGPCPPADFRTSKRMVLRPHRWRPPCRPTSWRPLVEYTHVAPDKTVAGEEGPGTVAAWARTDYAGGLSDLSRVVGQRKR